MHEMHIDFPEVINFDGRHILRHSIQAGLLVPPTVMVAPILDGILDHIEGDAIRFRPLFAGEARGQTCQLELALEEIQLIDRNGNLIGVS